MPLIEGMLCHRNRSGKRIVIHLPTKIYSLIRNGIGIFPRQEGKHHIPVIVLGNGNTHCKQELMEIVSCCINWEPTSHPLIGNGGVNLIHKGIIDNLINKLRYGLIDIHPAHVLGVLQEANGRHGVDFVLSLADPCYIVDKKLSDQVVPVI